MFIILSREFIEYSFKLKNGKKNQKNEIDNMQVLAYY